MAEQTRKRGTGLGLAKGLSVTLKTMLQPSVTQQYPHVKPDLPPRTRGVEPDEASPDTDSNRQEEESADQSALSFPGADVRDAGCVSHGVARTLMRAPSIRVSGG